MWTLPGLCSLSVAMIGEVSSQEKVCTTKGIIHIYVPERCFPDVEAVIKFYLFYHSSS